MAARIDFKNFVEKSLEKIWNIPFELEGSSIAIRVLRKNHINITRSDQDSSFMNAVNNYAEVLANAKTASRAVDMESHIADKLRVLKHAIKEDLLGYTYFPYFETAEEARAYAPEFERFDAYTKAIVGHIQKTVNDVHKEMVGAALNAA